MHTHPNDAIHLAAQTGDLAQMQALYEADPSVLARIHSLYDTSPLDWAAEYNQIAVIKWILDRQPDLIISRNSKNQLWIQYLTSRELQISFVEKVFNFLVNTNIEQATPEQLTSYVTCHNILTNFSLGRIKTKCITAMQDIKKQLEAINESHNNKLDKLILGCKAAIYMAESNLEDAKISLELAVSTDTSCNKFLSSMCLSLGLRFENKENYNEAFKWRDTAFRLCPITEPYFRTYINQVFIYSLSKHGISNLTEDELKKLNDTSVPNILLAQINDLMATYFFEQKELQKAEFYSQKTMQFCPQNAKVERFVFSSTLIQIYLEQGKFKYVTNLLKMISEPLSGIKLMRLANAYNAIGNALFKKQKYSEAESCWNLALQYSPGQTKLWLLVHYRLASTYLIQGKLKEAQSLLKKANGCHLVLCSELPSDLHPYKNCHLFVNKQQLYYVLEDGTKRNCYVRNLTEFRKAIQIEPSSDSKLNMDLTLSRISSIVASDHSDTSISLFLQTYYKISDGFVIHNQFSEARFYYQLIIHLLPKTEKFSLILTNLYSAITYLAEKNIKAAQDLLLSINHEECAKINILLGSAYYRIAKEFHQNEHYADAQLYYPRSLASYPATEKPAILMIRAHHVLTYLCQDNIKEAKNLLKINKDECLSIKEKPLATIYQVIGDQFYTKNLYEEAQSSYQTALSFCTTSQKQLQNEIYKKLASSHIKLGRCYLYEITNPANLKKAWECFKTAASANLSHEQRAELDTYLKIFGDAQPPFTTSNIQQIKRKMVRAVIFDSCLSIYKITVTLGGCELTLPADFSKTYSGFASEVTMTLGYVELFKFIESQAKEEVGICVPLYEFLNQLFIAKQEQLALEKLTRLRNEYSELITKVCVVYTRIKTLQHSSNINSLAEYLHSARQYKPTDADKHGKKIQIRKNSKINSLITRFTDYTDIFSKIFTNINENTFPDILDTFLTFKRDASKKLEEATAAYKDKNFQKGDSLLAASSYEHRLKKLKNALENLTEIEKRLHSMLPGLNESITKLTKLTGHNKPLAPGSKTEVSSFPTLPSWEQYIQVEELKDITDRAARYQETTQRTIVEIQTATANTATQAEKNEEENNAAAAVQSEAEENEEANALATASDTQAKEHEAPSQPAAAQPKNTEEYSALADAFPHALLYAPLTALTSPASDEAAGAAASYSHSRYSYYFSQPKYHAKAFELSAPKLEETTKQVEYIYHQFLKANDHDKTILTYALLTYLLSLIEDFKRQNNNAFPESVANKIRNFFYHSERDIAHTLMPQYYQAATQLINYLRDTKLPPEPRGINELRNMIGEGFLKEILLFKETETRDSETLAAKINTLHTEMDFTQSEIDDQDIKDAANRFMQGLSGALQAKLKERDFELYTKDFQQKEHKQARELGAQYRHTGFSIFQRERDSSAAAAAAANVFYEDSESTAAPHP